MQDKNPYYIYAIDYVKTSAGIRVLYVLCDALNKRGYESYVISNRTAENLNAPFLTKKIVNRHFRRKLTPIVIYPEVISGNPLDAPFYIRYYLCFADHFGVDLSRDNANMVWVYSKNICRDRLQTDNILFIPVVDRSIFKLPDGDVKREGVCYAALKYRYFHGKEVFCIPEGAVEITRDLPQSQTTKEVAELFQKSKYFYCFDNSALSIEATLCGCVTILMPNEHFPQIIGYKEFNGLPGVSWTDLSEPVKQAEESVKEANSNYDEVLRHVDQAIDDFICRTQESVKKTVYKTRISFRQRSLLASFIYKIADLLKVKEVLSKNPELKEALRPYVESMGLIRSRETK